MKSSYDKHRKALMVVKVMNVSFASQDIDNIC